MPASGEWEGPVWKDEGKDEDGGQEGVTARQTEPERWAAEGQGQGRRGRQEEKGQPGAHPGNGPSPETDTDIDAPRAATRLRWLGCRGVSAGGVPPDHGHPEPGHRIRKLRNAHTSVV